MLHLERIIIKKQKLFFYKQVSSSLLWGKILNKQEQCERYTRQQQRREKPQSSSYRRSQCRRKRAGIKCSLLVVQWPLFRWRNRRSYKYRRRFGGGLWYNSDNGLSLDHREQRCRRRGLCNDTVVVGYWRGCICCWYQRRYDERLFIHRIYGGGSADGRADGRWHCQEKRRRYCGRR